MTEISILRSQVMAFHTAMGLPVHFVPKVPSEDRVRLRLRLGIEEPIEQIEACITGDDEGSELQRKLLKGLHKLIVTLIDTAPIKVDLAKYADALGDSDFVNEGARLEFGIDGDPVAEAIHVANLAKVGGGTDEKGKIKKPEGWQPPDIAGALVAQGWAP